MFGYDLKQAATYFFQDEKRIIKVVILYILALLCIIPNITNHFSLLYLLLIFPILYFYGYLAKNSNLRILKGGDNLPELNDIGSYMLIGLKNIIGSMLFTLFCSLLMFAVVFAFTLILVLPSIFIGTLINAPNFLVSILTSATMILVGIACGIFFIISNIAAEIAFSMNLKFKSFFDFKLIKKIMFKNYKPFIKLLLVFVVLGICSTIISALLAITTIGKIFAPLISVYLFLIASDLYGQFISKSLNQVNEG